MHHSTTQSHLSHRASGWRWWWGWESSLVYSDVVSYSFSQGELRKEKKAISLPREFLFFTCLLPNFRLKRWEHGAHGSVVWDGVKGDDLSNLKKINHGAFMTWNLTNHFTGFFFIMNWNDTFKPKKLMHKVPLSGLENRCSCSLQFAISFHSFSFLAPFVINMSYLAIFRFIWVKFSFSLFFFHLYD